MTGISTKVDPGINMAVANIKLKINFKPEIKVF